MCPETEINTKGYLHPSSGKVVTYDHVEGKAGASRDATADECPTAFEDKRF